MPRSGDVPQSPESVEDGGDLGGALLGLASETGGEDFRFLTGGGQQLAAGTRGWLGQPCLAKAGGESPTFTHGLKASE